MIKIGGLRDVQSTAHLRAVLDTRPKPAEIGSLTLLSTSSLRINNFISYSRLNYDFDRTRGLGPCLILLSDFAWRSD
jgi:hypothetical protein